MKQTLKVIKSPVVISLLFTLPFMILELVNRRNLESFPIPLFALLWLLPLIFIVTLMPIIRDARTGKSFLDHPVILLIRVIFLALIVWMWLGIVIDQMPCFLGAPFCD